MRMMDAMRAKARRDVRKIVFPEGDEPRTIEARWLLPEGFTATGKRTLMMHAFNPHSDGTAQCDFVIKAGDSVEATSKAILEIDAVGRCTPMYIAIPLFG